MQQFDGATWRYTSLIVWPAALGLASIGGPLLRSLYGDRYAPAASAFAVAVGLSALPRLIDVPTRLLTVLGGQGTLLRWNVFAATVMLALDAALVPALCAVGGALANGAGQIIATVGLCIIGVRSYGLVIDWRFNLGVFGAAAVMALGVTLVGFALPDLAVLLLGPLVGCGLFVAVLCVFRPFDASDVGRAEALIVALPRSLRPMVRLTVARCASLPRVG